MTEKGPKIPEQSESSQDQLKQKTKLEFDSVLKSLNTELFKNPNTISGIKGIVNKILLNDGIETEKLSTQNPDILYLVYIDCIFEEILKNELTGEDAEFLKDIIDISKNPGKEKMKDFEKAIKVTAEYCKRYTEGYTKNLEKILSMQNKSQKEAILNNPIVLKILLKDGSYENDKIKISISQDNSEIIFTDKNDNPIDAEKIIESIPVDEKTIKNFTDELKQNFENFYSRTENYDNPEGQTNMPLVIKGGEVPSSLDSEEEKDDFVKALEAIPLIGKFLALLYKAILGGGNSETISSIDGNKKIESALNNYQEYIKQDNNLPFNINPDNLEIGEEKKRQENMNVFLLKVLESEKLAGLDPNNSILTGNKFWEKIFSKESIGNNDELIEKVRLLIKPVIEDNPNLSEQELWEKLSELDFTEINNSVNNTNEGDLRLEENPDSGSEEKQSGGDLDISNI